MNELVKISEGPKLGRGQHALSQTNPLLPRDRVTLYSCAVCPLHKGPLYTLQPKRLEQGSISVIHQLEDHLFAVTQKHRCAL